jgi:hypothetical protein
MEGGLRLDGECAVLLEEGGVSSWLQTWGSCVLAWLAQPCFPGGRRGKEGVRCLVLMAEQTDKTVISSFLARLEAESLEVFVLLLVPCLLSSSWQRGLLPCASSVSCTACCFGCVPPASLVRVCLILTAVARSTYTNLA